MTPVLLLVDLQNDYLAAPGLLPAAPAVVASAATLLEGFRARALPVLHIWTTVRPEPDRRMPHWQRAEKWACVAGTAGHDTPLPLRPRPGEAVLHKTFFSAFEGGLLEETLHALRCRTLVIAGVHLHGCVRATVLDAYQKGYEIIVADEATASDDPIHAAITRRYLIARAAPFESVTALLGRLDREPSLLAERREEVLVHRSPRDNRELWQVPAGGAMEVAAAAQAAREAWTFWRNSDSRRRADLLERLAGLLLAEVDVLAVQMAEEIGKPLTQGLAEVRRSAALLHDVASRADEPLTVRTATDACFRQRPLGVVAVISPWNNPLAIPLGKIAPALVYGNAVVWKPAPAATALAGRLLELLHAAGCPEGLVRLVPGDHQSAQRLAAADAVDAVTLSGSAAAGDALLEICARRRIPYQAELGGNNAAIVWNDADLADAAARIAEAAFGFAGQRCTANRRAIVAAGCFERFVRHLQDATAALVWGDPLAPATQVGPLVSTLKRDQVADLLARAGPAAEAILVPHAAQPTSAGAYYPPTIVCGPGPAEEIVQEETFGPVLVVQRAGTFDEALALCNGVRQGLVAALFSPSPRLQEQFLLEVRGYPQAQPGNSGR